MFYMLLSCVLTLMFREICHFNQSKGPFHLVSCQWRHTSSTKEYSAQDACVGPRRVCPLQWRLPKSNLHTYKIIHRPCCACSTQTVRNETFIQFEATFS